MSAVRPHDAPALELQRLSRLYEALSHINQAIVRTRTRAALFDAVCDVLVRDGGFRMTWIGWHDPETHQLVPVSQVGDEQGYLQSIRVYGDDRAEGHGPSGSAFRERRAYVCNDLFEDPATLPWRSEFERRGLRASAALPISCRGETCGVLNVYADRRDAFQSREVALLTEAAADISFALDNLADVEDRRRAEDGLARSEERYRTTLEDMLEGCQILDFDWRYRYLNRAAAQHNRRPNHELLGRRMPEAWPGIESTEVFALLARCMRERSPRHGEIEFVFADGTRGWFDVRARPVPEGIFVLSIDISERKQAEHALREMNERLELIVAERTRDLDAARMRAESADRLKSAFLATMSHELRTPLNSIIGFTGTLLMGLPGPLNAEQTRQLEMVRGSARHLLHLINDVLDISKIEAGQMEIRATRFDLRASIERVTASVKPLAEKKGLPLRVDLPADFGLMESDQRRVEQILLNLLNNAIKFTDRGEVTLSARMLESAASIAFVRIECADTGIGMKLEDMEALFQPFRQIDAGLQRHHEGTGLGLAICRRLAGLLGGSIRVRSEWGRGSVFTVDLPLQWNRA